MACACALNRNICVGGVKGLAMGISGVWGCHGVLGELAVRQDRRGWEGEARTGKLFDSCVFSPSWARLDSLIPDITTISAGPIKAHNTNLCKRLSDDDDGVGVGGGSRVPATTCLATAALGSSSSPSSWGRHGEATRKAALRLAIAAAGLPLRRRRSASPSLLPAYRCGGGDRKQPHRFPFSRLPLSPLMC
jgi:hypothetical protein